MLAILGLFAVAYYFNLIELLIFYPMREAALIWNIPECIHIPIPRFLRILIGGILSGVIGTIIVVLSAYLVRTITNTS